MRPLHCPVCGGRAFFANSRCSCGAALVYRPEAHRFDGEAAPCANAGEIGCNWAAETGGWCRACAMTEVAPDLHPAGNRRLWAKAELSKRRTLWGLMRWGWFAAADPGRRPVFHLLAEATRSGEAPVMMGHAAGLITINVAEADPAELVARREAFDEPYRSMIGHYRHELGHFLFERLLERPGFADAFRALFGDERADYGEALARHHQEGAPKDWAQRHISAYASAHPHEDWAETVAHALHLTDLADSFVGEGFTAPALPRADWDPYEEPDAAVVIETAGALGVSLNAVNRAMGVEDIYPFVLGDAARRKLIFARDALQAGPGGGAG